MSLFDSIISEAGQRFGLGDKSGTLLSALLALITDQSRGGFPGFLDRFSRAGLGDLASSWISSGDNAALSTQQVESALGEETIADIAGQADIDSLTAKSALAYMIPTVVDKLTPDGVVPEDKDLLSKIGDFLSGVGGTVPGPAAATVDLGKPVAVKGLDIAEGSRAVPPLGMEQPAGGAIGEATGSALKTNEDIFDNDNNRVSAWLVPLVLLGLLLVLGSWFCSKPPAG
jgi:uncharacterized protein YidB (DUF937 family)